MLHDLPDESLILHDGKQALGCGAVRLEMFVIPGGGFNPSQGVFFQFKAMPFFSGADFMNIKAVFDNRG
jgi:hypothetical protein